MNTTIRGGAIRKLSATRGYAGGGLLDKIKSAVGIKTDSPELAAYKANAAAERAAAKAPAPAPVQTPTTAIGSYAANTALAEREKAAGLKRGGAIRGPIGAMRAMAQKAVAKPAPPQRKMIDATPGKKTGKAEVESKAEDAGEPVNAERQEMAMGYRAGGAIRQMAQKKSAEGAKLKGPGTPTSDDIPATVVDTGEPIQVATGERIISKKQDAFLLAQAKADGFTSIDEWLEAGTGQPVGPTVKYSGGAKMAHAAGGMELDPNKGMFTGGDPYAIPGYTPDMIQRAGMGLAGYNPLTQGQTLNVPTNGGNANADDMEKTEAKGFACGGAIRKHMATGGVVGQLVKLPFVSLGYDHSKVQSLGPGLRGAAGGASPEELAHNKALESAQALATARASGAKLTPEAESANRTSYLADLQASNDMKPSTPYMKQAKADANQAASGALRTIYGSPVQAVAPPSAVQQPAQLPAAQAAPPAAIPTATVQAPAPQPVSTPVAQPVQLSPADGVNVGNGITRFDAPGKSPLFTNMTDAAGMASNQALMNRGAIRPEDQAIAQAMSDRFGREAQNTNQRAANATQMATETAMAQRSTDAGLKLAESVGQRIDGERARQNAESTLSIRNINPAQRQAASDTLKNLNQRETAREAAAHVDSRAAATDATTRRGQDIQAQGQAVQAGALRANQKLAQDRFGIEQSQESRAAAKDALDAKQRDRLQSAFDAYDKDPSEKSAERVRVLMGKEKATPPDSWGIRKVTDATGAVTEIPYNKATGEDRGSNQAGQAPLPPGMVKQVGTANGKPVYLDKNGKQVIAKG